MSGVFMSDGRMRGNLTIQTVNCDQTANTCTITVPAPGVALVFLKNDAYGGPSNDSPTVTFSTTSYTKNHHATVDPSVLATSNGHSGTDLRLGSTSKRKTAGAPRRVVPSIMVLFSIVFGANAARLTLAR